MRWPKYWSFSFSIIPSKEIPGLIFRMDWLDQPITILYLGGRPSSAGTAAATKSLQSCLTLCDPIDSSPPVYPIPGILQARTLEWVAISFSSA